MQSRALSLLFVGMLTVGGFSSPSQEKVLLRFQPEEGQSAKSKGSSRISFDAGGQKVTISEEGTYQTEVVSAGDGKYVLRSTILSSKASINGDPLPPNEDDGDTKTTYGSNGQILEIEHNPAIEEELQLVVENSLAVGGAIIFKDSPVGAGDTWTHDYPANKLLKVAAAVGKFSVLAIEELDGVPVAKIKMEWAEKSGSPVLKVVSTQWIEIASGDSIKVESQVTGAKFDLGMGEPTLLSIDSNSSRTSGGLIQSDTNKEEEDQGGIDAAVEGFEKLDGLLTIWRKEEDGSTQLKAEIKKEQLGKLMMMQTTASSGLADGRLAAGDPISDLVFEFRRLPNNRLAMFVPNYFYRADTELPIAKAVRRSFPDSIIQSFAIEAEQEDRESVLVDVTEMFRGDLGRLTELLAGGGNPLLGGGGNAFMLDRENSYLSGIKSFPENIVVESTMNFLGRGGGGMAALLGGGTKNADDRSVVVRVAYNIFELPDGNGYQPRYFDPRVGFFTNDYQSFNDPTGIDQKKMLINRWNLVKRDPAAAVSDPVEPIVFWIDNAVPEDYREVMKEAIEGWNAAFLEAGFSNAVVAMQMPDDADFDHADMRYNVVRWVTSPDNAYAIALFRTSPITGQILNGSVTVDANIVRAFAGEYGQYVRPEAWQVGLRTRLAKLAAAGKINNQCDLLATGNLNMLTGMMAAAQLAGVSRDDYIKEFVRWVVGHEVGHMMGLRHNFVASTLLTLDELGDSAKVGAEGTAASVMDYVAFNPAALKKSGVDFYGQTVGRYDKWAISYGYTPFEGKSSEEERYDLYQIAQNGTRDGLAWLGDEYADGIDPYVTRFDLGSDPLAYWSEMGLVARRLILDLPNNTMKQGEDFYSFSRDFNQLMNMYGRSSIELTRFIGGVRRSPAFPNDANAGKPIVNVPGTVQKAALDQVAKMAFDPEAFNFPKSFFKNLVMNPKGELIESLMGGQNDFPMRDEFAGLQAAVLSSILDPGTLNRVINAEFEAEAGESVLTLAELFGTLKTSVWAELKSGSAVAPLRRDLQRTHVDLLISMILEKTPASAEVIAASRWQLDALKKEVGTAAKRAKDQTTVMHYSDLADRISKALDARPTIGASGGGGGLSLADLLGGMKRTSGTPRG